MCRKLVKRSERNAAAERYLCLRFCITICSWRAIDCCNMLCSSTRQPDWLLCARPYAASMYPLAQPPSS